MKKFSFILIFIFFNLSLFGNVKLKAPDYFIKGEPFYFEFEAYGSSVKFPRIDKIDDFLVESLGTSRSLQIINGKYDEKISKKYKIVPTKTFSIPSFKFEINDKEVFSKIKKIAIKKIEKTKSDNSAKSYEENGYMINELDFLLFPQKSGALKINPLSVDVQMMDTSSSSRFGFFSASPKTIKVYSNILDFEVKDLPKNISIIGDFNLKASINKNKIKIGESISYRLEIQGIGNLDDIEDIKLSIPNTTIYDNKPELETKYTANGYEGIYSKVYSIIPNSSLEIPSITFKYFSKKDKKIITKKTKVFNIKVEGIEPKKVVLEKPKEIKKIQKEIIIEKDISLEEKIIYFLLGIIFSLLIFGLISYVKLQKTKKISEDTPLNKQIKNSKNKGQIIKILIPYLKKDEKLDSLIYQCELRDKDFKILKKEILERLNQIKI